MKPTKRQCDPLGRSKTRHRYSRYLLSLAITITGSVWPIQARSIEAIFDTPVARLMPALAPTSQAVRRAALQRLPDLALGRALVGARESQRDDSTSSPSPVLPAASD